MSSKLIPDYILPDYRAVTPSLLREAGIRALLVDIDNTLAPYEVAEPDGEVRAWVEALRADGVQLAFLSNNHPPRVELFNRTLGLPAYPDAQKPLKRIPRIALAAVGGRAEETAVLGDQIFTDVLTGRRLGLRTLLVPPIKDKRDPFTRFKRLLERRYIRAYARRALKQKEDTDE